MEMLELFKNIEYLAIYNDIDSKINNFVIDTRKVKEGDCYIGIKGENNDGNSLYMEAFEAGAKLVILENFLITDEVMEYLKENEKSIMLVRSTVEALGEIAKYKRSLFHQPVVAITGSAGKTSTKDIIYSVLHEKYKAHKTIGNQNNHIGLPLSILSLEEDREVMVLEMGMNHLGEISYLTSIARPDVAVITNVGTAHIGNLGSRENILKAKLEILEGLNKDGVVIINNDNDLLHSWYLENKDKYHIITIGIHTESDYVADIIEMNEFSSRFSCDNEIYKVPVGGEHFIYNALVGIAVGSYFHESSEEIKKGIIDFELSSNRMNIIETGGITIVNDSYNANFDSMRYAVKYLSSLKGRNIAVLGTMKELGEYSEELHRKIGEVVASEPIDVLITVGEEAKYINLGANENGFVKKEYHFNSNEEAIKLINEIKQENDNILVKASLSMNFKEIVDALTKEG